MKKGEQNISLYYFSQEVLFFPQMKPDDPNKNKEIVEEDKVSQENKEK